MGIYRIYDGRIGRYLRVICNKYKLFIMEARRIAKAGDFKVGTTLFDLEGNSFGLRRKYAEGIWESNYKVHFENEAHHYRVRCDAPKQNDNDISL